MQNVRTAGQSCHSERASGRAHQWRGRHGPGWLPAHDPPCTPSLAPQACACSLHTPALSSKGVLCKHSHVSGTRGLWRIPQAMRCCKGWQGIACPIGLACTSRGRQRAPPWLGLKRRQTPPCSPRRARSKRGNCTAAIWYACKQARIGRER
jgi:hypothetical protein